MLDATAWRLRWLLETAASLERLRGVLAASLTEEARLVRSMIAGLREARRGVAALATWAEDVAALARDGDIGPDLAAAAARRLRGEVRGHGGAGVMEALGRLAARLGLRLGAPASARPVPGLAAPGPTGVVPDPEPAAAPRAFPAEPLPPPAATGPAWVMRTRDVAWALRGLGLAVASGQLPAGLAALPLHPVPRRGGGYVRVSATEGAPGLRARLRLCGLVPVAPAPLGL